MVLSVSPVLPPISAYTAPSIQQYFVYSHPLLRVSCLLSSLYHPILSSVSSYAFSLNFSVYHAATWISQFFVLRSCFNVLPLYPFLSSLGWRGKV